MNARVGRKLVTQDASYGTAFDVQPFGNQIVRMRMSGTDVAAVLAEQERPGQPQLLVAGLPKRLEPARSYVAAASDFLAAGGEGFGAFTRGTGRETVGTDIDALVALVSNRYPVDGRPSTARGGGHP